MLEQCLGSLGDMLWFFLGPRFGLARDMFEHERPRSCGVFQRPGRTHLTLLCPSEVREGIVEVLGASGYVFQCHGPPEITPPTSPHTFSGPLQDFFRPRDNTAHRCEMCSRAIFRAQRCSSEIAASKALEQFANSAFGSALGELHVAVLTPKSQDRHGLRMT